MQKYQDFVLDSKGRAVSGASVTVTTSAGATATIYSDNGSATQTNPMTTGSDGGFAFYAADGRYNLTISGAGFTSRTISDILLEDPVDGTSALASSAGSSLVGFIQSGTGAVARTAQAKMREVLSVVDFSGFVGDGTSDDSEAVQAAIDAALDQGKGLFCPTGFTVKLDAAVDFRGLSYIDFQSPIEVDPAIVGVPVTVGGGADGGSRVFRFSDVTDGTSTVSAAPPSRPVFRIFGLKSSEVTLGDCNYLQLYADAADAPDGTSNAYNRIYLNGVHSKVELAGAAGVSWNNENRFYGGRLIRLVIDGTNYSHNHNKFFEPTFEGDDVEIEFINAWTNQIYGARFEGCTTAPGVTFDADSYGNSIFCTWSGTGVTANQFIKRFVPVSDSGAGNMVTTESASMFRKTALFNASPSSLLIAVGSSYSSAASPNVNPNAYAPFNRDVLTPSLAGLTAPAFALIALSPPIPVELGDVIAFDVDFDGDLLRPAVYVFDSEMKPLTSEGAGGAYITSAGWSFTEANGLYAPGADQSASTLNDNPAAVVRSEVAYVRVGMFSGAGGFFRSASASLFTQSLGRGVTEGGAAPTFALRAVPGVPTRGYMPLDFCIYDSTNKRINFVSFQHETLLDGALAAGETSVTVDTISTVANGDVAGILLDDETTHWTTVSALAGSTFTIDAIPVGRSAPDGGRIVFNRWTF